MDLLLQKNIPLSDKNWFKTGGTARYYAQPQTIDDIQRIQNYAHKNNLEIFLLGQGANTLINDNGCNGIVMHMHNTDLSHTNIDNETAFVCAGAGCTINDLIEYCLDHKLTGLEEFSGIPGSVGASVFINVHYFQHAFSDFVVDATLVHLKTGNVITVNREWLNFGYDYSRLHEEPYIVYNATFRLKRSHGYDAAFAQGRRTEIIRHRNSRYPTARTCGCFFKNFSEDHVSIESNGKKMIYVAYYLDKLGIKGQLCHGGACVSYQHANMIVTRPDATSHDIVQLARTMQQMVFDEYGILPEAECQFLGFDEYPLLNKIPIRSS